MKPQSPYDSPHFSLKLREELADLWERENTRGHQDALAGRLGILATDLAGSIESGDVVEVIASLKKLVPEIEELAKRLP